MKQILIVEDDTTMNKMLSNILLAEGYQVASAYTVTEAQNCFRSAAYDLAILDINLPDGSGYEVCKAIKKNSHTAVIFLTANDLERDMIKGYELGAADYITKPFNIKIVLKKIQVVLDRGSQNQENRLRIKDLMIDFDNRVLKKRDTIIYLTPTEFDLLNIFVKHKNTVLTRDVLLEKLWDSKNNFVDEHTLTLNISRLRSKLDDENNKYIKTIYGVGYKFSEE